MRGEHRLHGISRSGLIGLEHVEPPLEGRHVDDRGSGLECIGLDQDGAASGLDAGKQGWCDDAQQMAVQLDLGDGIWIDELLLDSAYPVSIS